MPITNVIFDMGNVLIPLDQKSMKQKFSELGAKNVETIFEQEDVQKLWKDYDAGLETAAFRAAIKEKLNIPDAKDEQIDEAWNAVLGKIPNTRFEMMQNLRKEGKKVFVLSNCNTLHHDFIQQEYGKLFTACTNKQYYSHLLKMTKPNNNIYRHTLTDSKLIPEETLFLDDRLENVEGAKNAGIHAKQITIDTPNAVVFETIKHINTIERKKRYEKVSVVAAISAVLITGFFAAKEILAQTTDSPSPSKAGPQL